jgi:hypothetical protein
MDRRRTEIIRRRTLHSLSPTTAAVAGLSLEQLVQFVAGTVHPDDVQLCNLARHLGVEDRIR